ncbi:RNA-directed DNA polymerase from mobile element jockey [Trichonephila clavipes]|nr:RNA-directed DNA polymerase from mobile element jockey [Trichonephila clavipes]
MINLYADDTAISATYKNTKSVTIALNKHLALLEKYFNDWKIKINVDKTVAVLFTKARKPIAPPTLYSTPLRWSQSTKYLGITFDKTLTWKPHILYARDKFRIALKKLYPLICRNSNMYLYNKVLLYTAVLRPILSYGCPIWGYAANTNIKILETAQNSIIRCIEIFNPSPLLSAQPSAQPLESSLVGRNSPLSLENKVVLYKQVLRPIITYASPVWGAAAATHMKKIQVIQNKILRLITNAPWYVRNDVIHYDLHMEPISSYITKLARNVFRSIENHDNPIIRAQTMFTYPHPKLKYAYATAKWQLPLKPPEDSHFLLTSNRSALFHTTGSTTTERPSIKTDSPLLYEMTSLLRTSASPPMSPHQSSCSNHTAKESTAPREPQRTLKTLYYFTQDSKRTHD